MLIHKNDIPQYIIDKYDTWNGEREKWLTRALRSEEYYYNDVEGTSTNYTQQQLDRIAENSNIPVTINYIYPQVNQKYAILAQSKPSFRMISMVEDDILEKMTSIIDGAKYSVMYKSNSESAIQSHLLDMLKLGMGILVATEETYYTPGEFGIAVEYLHPSYVILDSNCKRKDLADMTGFFITKQITYAMASMMYQTLIDQLNQYYGLKLRLDNIAGSYFGANVGQNYVHDNALESPVNVTEFYDHIFTTKYIIESPDTKELKSVFEENFFPEQWAIIKTTVKGEEKGIYVRKTIFLGNDMIAFFVYPEKKFPIAVTFFEFGGRPYRSYGMIHFMRGMQEAYDKLIQIMLVNGILSNNAGVEAPVGSIPPEHREQWEVNYNNPMVIKEYVPVIMDGQLLKPERQQIQPLSNFYVQVLQLLQQGMEYSSGINPTVSGNPGYGTKVDTFSTLQQYQSAAMQRIQLSVNEVNKTMEILGNSVIEKLIETLNPEEVYIFLNKDQEEIQMTLPVEVLNNLRQSKYKIIAIPSTSSPSQKLAMAQGLMNIAQTTQSPYERNVYIQKAFDLSDMKEFEDMKDEIDQVRQLEQQINQQAQELKRKDETNKQMENKVISAELKAKVAEALASGIDEINTKKAEAKLEIEIEKLKEQLKEEKSDKKEKNT